MILLNFYKEPVALGIYIMHLFKMTPSSEKRNCIIPGICDILELGLGISKEGCEFQKYLLLCMFA
jgi:hypothetical protein